MKFEVCSSKSAFTSHLSIGAGGQEATKQGRPTAQVLYKFRDSLRTRAGRMERPKKDRHTCRCCMCVGDLLSRAGGQESTETQNRPPKRVHILYEIEDLLRIGTRIKQSTDVRGDFGSLGCTSASARHRPNVGKASLKRPEYFPPKWIH